jgi:hypothetical protein
MTPSNGKIGLVYISTTPHLMWTDYMSHLVAQPLCTCFVARIVVFSRPVPYPLVVV